jgi:DNA polymerase-3 subunit gamma/tau
LEEPPAHTIFILATTEIYKVPATIISRCQRFDFRKVNLSDLVERLKLIASKEDVRVDSKILENIARHAEGSIRDAESLLGQILSLVDSSKIVNESQAELVIPKSDFNLAAEFTEYLFQKKTEDGLRFVNSLVEEGRDLEQFLQDLIEFLRKILLAEVGGNLNRYSFELDENLENKVLKLSKEISSERLVAIIELLVAKKRETKLAAIVQLPLELAVVEICGSGEGERAVQEPVQVVESSTKNVIEKDEKKEINPAPRVQPKISSKGGIKVDLEQIKEKWPEVLKQAQELNHSLPLVLRVGEPTAMEGNALQIGFKYRFHKERMNEVKNRAAVEKILKKIFNEEIKINSIIADVVESSNSEEVGLNKILEEFGGKVVE